MWDRLPLATWSHRTLPPPKAGGVAGCPDHTRVFPSLTVLSFKGTSRNGATGGWGKLQAVATQGLRGDKTPWQSSEAVLALPQMEG